MSFKSAIRFAVPAVIAFAAIQPALGDVIYENTTAYLGSRSFTQLQIGDEVQAAGSARIVTELHIGLTMQGFVGTADLQPRLYANDGVNGAPGTMLWEDAVHNDVPMTGGDDLVRFDVPGIEVPDTFTWTIQISDTRPVAVGLPHYGPPSRGSSPTYAWFGNGTNWTKLTDPNGRSVDFMAKVVARPSGGGITLAVASQCPSGGGIVVEWGGATPGGQIALLFARGTGSFVIPNNRPCPGTVLGLSSNQLQIAYTGSAGQGGSRMLQSNIGPGVCGGWLQLLDLSTCATSNAAQIR